MADPNELRMVAVHHQRFDGAGHPDQLCRLTFQEIMVNIAEAAVELSPQLDSYLP
jgi:hypothetical protein